MTRINSLNIKVTGSDLRVSTTSETVIGGITWETYVEAMTAAQWNTATGLTARQIINPWDVANVTFTTDNDVSRFNDKSGGTAHLDVLGLVNLIKDGGRNVAEIVSAFVGSDDLSTYTSGNGFSKPFVLGLCYKFNQIPASEQTLWSIGHTSTSGRRSLSVTSSGYLKYAYSDDSGNTLTTTGSDVIPLGTPCVIWLACERSKVRVYMHGGVWDHKKTISAEGAFNTTSTITQMAIGGYYTAGITSQSFASGFYLGHVFADGVCKDTYEAIEATCSMFNVSYTTQDVGDFSNGLVSVIVGPGAGGLATPKADVVDLVAGTVFTATGTQAATTAGRFHNAIPLTMTASTVYMQGTVPAAWNVFSGSYGNFTLYGRFKTGTIDASTRSLFCLGSNTSTPFWRVSLNTSGQLTLNINTSVRATSTITCTSDTWYDVVIKYDGTTYTFSVNGETAVTFTLSTNASVVGGKFNIGASYLTDTTIQHPGRGHLDCLALWSRSLSSDEIIQIRNSGTGRDGFFEYLQSEIASGGGGSTLRYVGTMVSSSGNTNIQLKSASDYTSPTSCQYLTFISPYSGTLRDFIMWFKTYTAGGYSGGTLGTYEIKVRNDNSGVPGSTVISSIASVGSFVDPGSPSATANTYRRVTFTTAGSVVAGTKYHMVVRNIASSPSVNWTSLNTAEAAGIPAATLVNLTDYTKARPLWTAADFRFHHLDDKYQPGTPYIVLGVDTDASGTTDSWFGCPYADPIAAYSNVLSARIGGSNQIRMPIKFSSTFQAVGIAIAAYRTAGTGDVTATLKNSGGTTLATATLTGSQFNNTASPTRIDVPYWSYGLFDANPSLASATQYYVHFSAPSDTYVYPCVMTYTADTLNSNCLSAMDGTKGGWWGNTQALTASSNSGSTWGTLGNGQRNMSFYLSGY